MSPADSLFASLPAAPGPHPAPAELRAYAAGTLAPAVQHRIEAHALDCERCADVLAGLAMSDAATTDQAVATLRARLQARVQAAPPAALPARWWPRVAAAAALLGVVAGGVWTWEQRPATTGAVAGLPATAHPETAASSAPVAAPAPSTAMVPSPTPAATPPADYAAVPPPPPLSRPGRLRSPARPAIDDLAQAEQPVAREDMDAASAADAETADVAAASVAAAPVAKKQLATEPAKREATADSTVAAEPGAVAGGMAKAKARAMPARSAPATGAAAYATATPMPAAPALAPAPVGGTLALRDYLRREAAGFVPAADASRLTGTVRVRLVIGADGKVAQLQIIRGLRSDYDAEALRLVCEGPAWQPGVAGGQRAALPVELVVPF